MTLTIQSAMRKDRDTATCVSLQHRHFAFIAAVLADSKPAEWNAGLTAQWIVTVNQFVAACRKTNPKFDTERFLRAVYGV